MKLLVSHPTLNANSKNLVIGLLNNKLLFKLFTSIAIFPGQILHKLGNNEKLKDLKRRRLDESWRPYTSTKSFYEFGRLITSKLNLECFVEHEKGLFCVDNVYAKHDKWVASSLQNAKKNGVTAVYAYEDGALDTFIKAKELGLVCIYDLPIAYWETGRKLMQEEAIRMPHWAITLGGGILDSQVKMDRKCKELELADIVIGPGSFVLNSLPEWSKNKTKILSPFGSPNFDCRVALSNKSYDKPLRVLFVGSMGQRKGLGDLFEAINELKGIGVELVVLGSLLAPMKFYNSQVIKFTHETGRSNEEVLKLMRTCDVFCLPSIVEGRALVMQEAMSQGLPIIITPNTGGEDLVVEGETGFLIPIRAPKAIAEKIKWFLENRDQVVIMGEKAAKHAQKYTWDNYSENIINKIKSILK